MSISKRVSIFIVSISVSFPYLNLVTASIFYLSPSNTTLSHLALLFGSVIQSFVFSLCLLFLPSTALIPLNPCHTSFHLSSSTSIFLHFHQLLSSFPLLCLFHSLLLFFLQMHFFHAQMEIGLSHTPLCIS